MSKSNVVRHVSEEQKSFLRVFDQFSQRHNRWEIWSDFIAMSAIAVSNAVDKEHEPEREKEYLTRISKYDKADQMLFPCLFTELTEGIESHPDCDFLGELYMACDLGNDHMGQFFTPYSVCQMMAAMSCSNAKEQIEERGFISVNDPTCGAGALLVACARDMLSQGIDYQSSILFAGQDIDRIVGMMCYLQLSLHGCAGYVTLGDSLASPQTYYDAKGLFPVDNGNVWYTPMWFSSVWKWRRVYNYADLMVRQSAVK